MPLTFFPSQKSVLKSLEVKPEAAAMTIIDGARRRLTPSVFVQVTRTQIQGETETRYFSLHSKRGKVPNSLINWLKSYLREKGWVFCGATVERERYGNWEGVFRK